MKTLSKRYKKLFLIMKVSAFLLVVTLMNVSASTHSKSKKLDMDLKNASVKEVFYEVMLERGLQQKIYDQPVILKKRELEKAIKKDLQSSIRGKVLDNATGEPILGATVVVKGTTKGMITNINGEFTLDAEEGSVLVVSFVGYSSVEVTASKEFLSIRLVPSTTELEDVMVVGSFSNRARTNVERPVPVDVLSAKELDATGQTELGQMIHFQAPSFHSTKYGISNVTSYIDPATLRGMGTDQTLVLINGKRRHQSAALNVNRVVGKGSVGTDLNAIPTAAIKRIEILRNGAAAQYGSDAIAGIVNVILKDSDSEGSISTDFGVSSQGDGELYKMSVNYGSRINKKEGSYVNTTLSFRHSGETDRKDTYKGYVYDSNPVVDEQMIAQNNFDRDKDVGTKFGQARNNSASIFINSAYPVSKNWEFYSLMGISYKDLLSFGFFRQPGRSERSVLSIFPKGYSPLFPATSTDIQGTFGFRKVSLDDWNIDFNGTYGKNLLATFVKDGPNASYQQYAPSEYFVGNNNFGHQNVGVTISKTTFSPDNKALTLAFGAQIRREEYQITKGDRVGYTEGPFPQFEFSSTGKIAFSPKQAVNKDRTNFGIFADIEKDLTEKLLFGAAIRYENYSDFGSNFSGKISTRYKLNEEFSIRGSVNRGFRAPSLHQVHFSANDPQFDAGNIVNVLHLRQDDALVKRLGYGNLKAETSLDFNLGITAQIRNKFLLTIDAYQINIKDRVIISENLKVKDIGLDKEPEVVSGGIGEIQFFTNAVDTKTRGIDLVFTYNENVGSAGKLTTSLAATFNRTTFDGEVRTSKELQAYNVKILDVRTKGLIEVAQPRNKLILSVGYSTSKFNGTIRATRFGEIQDVDSRDSDNNFQIKSAKIVTGLNLGYNIISKLKATVSISNLFDVYPDRNEFGGTFNGLSPYGRSTSQFGLMGRFYTVGLSYSF